MAPELFKVSVPGSMMIMGEHAVLYGKTALVSAINRRLTIQLLPIAQPLIEIEDSRLGLVQQNLTDISVVEPFKFVITAIKQFQDQITHGFKLHINSEFSSVVGMGSSAAVTVATVAVLARWLNIPLSQRQIFEYARQVMMSVQGVGSGADLAASVFGGVVCYSLQQDERTSKPIAQITMVDPIPDFTAIYSGFKTPTPEVIQIVKQRVGIQPQYYAQIFTQMQQCTMHALDYIRAADWENLGKIFNEHHRLQAALGTSNTVLDALVGLLNTQQNIYGAKISGSGLGDCVIGLGKVFTQLIPANDVKQQFSIKVDTQGITYASN